MKTLLTILLLAITLTSCKLNSYISKPKNYVALIELPDNKYLLECRIFNDYYAPLYFKQDTLTSEKDTIISIRKQEIKDKLLSLRKL
jgi:hypothetical protein